MTLFSQNLYSGVIISHCSFDHTLLLDRSENWVGPSGTVPNWFQSNLQDRTYFISSGNLQHDLWSTTKINNRPLLFDLYVLLLSQFFGDNDSNYHAYADDTTFEFHHTYG